MPTDRRADSGAQSQGPVGTFRTELKKTDARYQDASAEAIASVYW